MVPKEFQFLFPSISVSEIDPKTDKFFVIDSLLRLATGDAWKWMLKTYSFDDIAEVVKSSRRLTPRDVYYWMYRLNLQPEEILCLQKSSQRQFYPY